MKIEYNNFFLDLITGYLNGRYSRGYVADKLAKGIEIDEIPSDLNSLLTNCEWALRHINEANYYTTDKELEYYLSCFHGEKLFDTSERDRAAESNLTRS